MEHSTISSDLSSPLINYFNQILEVSKRNQENAAVTYGGVRNCVIGCGGIADMTSCVYHPPGTRQI